MRDQKYILKTEHGEENKMYLFLFKTMIFYLGWASSSSMNPHNNKNLIQTWDSLIHEYAIHHHIVLCYNIKNSNTAQCNITCYALRLMGTKNHAHDNDYQTTFVFLSSNQLCSFEYTFYCWCKSMLCWKYLRLNSILYTIY